MDLILMGRKTSIMANYSNNYYLQIMLILIDLFHVRVVLKSHDPIYHPFQTVLWSLMRVIAFHANRKVHQLNGILLFSLSHLIYFSSRKASKKE